MSRLFPTPLIVILLATAGVYAASIGNGFVNLDDPLLVTENTHVQEPSAANVGYVFTHFDPELYIPVTLLSYQLEAWTFGPAAWHFHLTNILLHLVAVTLVFSIANRLSRTPLIATATAALFALHPLNSEAVLWIAARKDLLSAVYTLGSIAAYLRARDRKKAPVLSTALFVLALGSKVSVVSLPVALAGWEYAQGTLQSSKKRLSLFLFPAIVFGIVAMLGKGVVASQFSGAAFLIMVFRSIFFYLQLIFLPLGQAASHHLLPHDALKSPMLPLAILTVAGLIAVAWRMRKSVPLFTTGIAFFFVMIAPSLFHYAQGNGMVQLGAERYAYLANAGIFLAVAVCVERAFGSVSEHVRRFLAVACIIILGVFAYLTLIRTFVFADAVIFNVDILQKSPHNARAWYSLGKALEEARRPQEAEAAYGNALTYEPSLQESAIALGILLMKEGRSDEGLEMLRHATAIRPDSFKGHFNLGVALQNLKRYPEAEEAYRSSIERFPDFPMAHRNLAVVLGIVGRKAEAMAEYEILSKIDPGFRREFEALKAESSTEKK